jgi:hypothetical protein
VAAWAAVVVAAVVGAARVALEPSAARRPVAS